MPDLVVRLAKNLHSRVRHMLIRVYREADEQDVIALWDEALADGAPHNDPPTAIRRKLAVDGDLLLVAEIDGRVVGTA